MNRRDLIFRVFVSSTFSDLIAERNALQEKTFPQLREYCHQRGARFQAIDLRWGVSQEAALDQQTMNICQRELERCQTLSPRPNFIVLLGDRYGWHPLPAQIAAQEFEEILSRIPRPDKPLLVSDGEVPPWRDGQPNQRIGWYRKDLNAAPAEYALQPRTIDLPQGASDEDGKRIRKEEDADWSELESQMRGLILVAIGQLGWAPDDPRRVKYEASATHQEILAGAVEAEDPQSHVFCYFRKIDALPADDSAAEYRDIKDGAANTKAEGRLTALKERLTGLLPDEHVYPYDAEWRDGQVEADLDALCERVREDLQRIIDSELEAFQQASELEREQRSHREFAEERVPHFTGREDILGRIGRYVEGDEAHPLAVYGRSGSGKTAVLAKAALDLEAAGNVTVVTRFIGATPASSELRTLLSGLCSEFGAAYGHDDEIKTDMNELVQDFRKRLEWAGEDQPLAVFVDALEQLDPGGGPRSMYWLPRELPPHVKFVVSVLAEEGEAGDCYDAASRTFPAEALVELGPLSAEHGDALLDAWLADANRTLQPPQRDEVVGRFAGCPYPLYLKVAFEEARLWKSWEAPPSLSGDVTGILDDLLDRLEHPEEHGAVLVARSLGYLGAARQGLTEDEMLDVLSADADVMRDFRERSPESPKVKRLPVIVWSRLYGDLERNMARRRADGTVVLSFYHRQVREAVQRRYLTNDDKLRAHVHLAGYFDKKDYWLESLEAQQERAKRLPPTPRPANIRKVDELPWQLLEVAKVAGGEDPNSEHWNAVADLLTHWEFLEAKAEAQA